MAFNLPSLTKSDLDPLWRNRKINILDDIFGNFYQSLPTTFSLKNIDDKFFLPRLDISETDSTYYLEVEVPGIEEKNIDVRVDNNILTVKGTSEVSSENKDCNYYMQERSYGAFQRSVTLPSNVNENDITAKFKNGILEVKIPKKEQRNAKKIAIKN